MTFLQDFFQDLRRAARANFIPALLLQAVAFSILWSYHHLPEAQAAFDRLADFKTRTGPVFAFASSAIGGAIFPFILQSLQRGSHRRIALSTLPIFIVFWGSRGWLVDGFYQLQSFLWGDNAHLSTLLAKIVCDLGLFSPLIGVPTLALIYGLADCNFQWKDFRRELRRGWYTRHAMPIVRMAFIVWLPALFVIYALPQALQFPVAAIIQCFWALVLVVLTDRTPPLVRVAESV